MDNKQAVLVHLDGTSLPHSVYEEYDLTTLEDELIAVIEQGNLGEFDGNEVGPTSATLYMYGPNAEALFTSIEPILRVSPLCQNATVVVRAGSPGDVTTEIRLPMLK